jgi:ubiquinone biosynthesis monooxygenase Coq7
MTSGPIYIQGLVIFTYDDWTREFKQEENSMGTTQNYVLRPRVELNDIHQRGKDASPEKLKSVRKGLRTLHNLELMATTIYRFQITKEENERNRQLVAAMCNEASHYADFTVKLYEYGFKPFKLRWFWWFVGVFFGLGSRILGPKTILKTGIWVETQAVHHYGKLLETIEWEEETREVIEKDREDETIHIRHWKALLMKE